MCVRSYVNATRTTAALDTAAGQISGDGEEPRRSCSCAKRGWHRCSTLSDAAVSCRLKMRKVVLMVKVLKAWQGFRKKLGSLSATSLASTMSSMLGARGAPPTESGDANDSTSRLRTGSQHVGIQHSATTAQRFSTCSCLCSMLDECVHTFSPLVVRSEESCCCVYRLFRVLPTFWHFVHRSHSLIILQFAFFAFLHSNRAGTESDIDHFQWKIIWGPCQDRLASGVHTSIHQVRLHGANFVEQSTLQTARDMREADCENSRTKRAICV